MTAAHLTPGSYIWYGESDLECERVKKLLTDAGYKQYQATHKNDNTIVILPDNEFLTDTRAFSLHDYQSYHIH